MASPLTIAGFPDVLDPRFREITDGEYALEQDMVGTFYSKATPTQFTERGSALTPMGIIPEFTGTLLYDGPDQGYDWQATHKEFAGGTQVERLLVEFDNFDVIETRYKLLARSARQTRQIHAARIFTQAFSVDTFFGSHTENLALCSDSHTTTRAGVSTTTGFDNLVTTPLSPTALKAAYIQFRKVRDNAGQPIDSHTATHIVLPVDLEDRAKEIFGTMKGLDAADQNKNVLENRYTVVSWIRLTDVNNWFIINKPMMMDSLFWFDKQPPEFSRVGVFDEYIAKYAVYMIYTVGRADWRWILGANVS